MIINLDAWLKHTSVCIIYDRTQPENKLFFLKKNKYPPCKRIFCSTMKHRYFFHIFFFTKLRIVIIHLQDVVS